MKSLLLGLALVSVCEAMFNCSNMKLLTNDSPDRTWFAVKTSDNASPPKVRKLLAGYGYEEGEPPFRGNSHVGLTITIAARDGSFFSIKRFQIISTHSDLVEFSGIFSEGLEKPMTFERQKVPRQYKGDEEWEITKVTTRKQMEAIKIDVNIHSRDLTSPDRRIHRLFLRDLRLEACVAEPGSLLG